MSVHEPGDGRLEQEISRVRRESDPERPAESHATERPAPPADDARTRGVLAQVRALLARRRGAGQRP